MIIFGLILFLILILRRMIIFGVVVFFLHSIFSSSQNTKSVCRIFFLAISIFQLVRQPVEAFVESIPRGGTGRLLVFSIFQLVRQPVKAFVESISRGGTGRLNVPIPVSQRMKS